MSTWWFGLSANIYRGLRGNEYQKTLEYQKNVDKEFSTYELLNHEEKKKVLDKNLKEIANLRNLISTSTSDKEKKELEKRLYTLSEYNLKEHALYKHEANNLKKKQMSKMSKKD